jgi:hypothetical protein
VVNGKILGIGKRRADLPAAAGRSLFLKAAVLPTKEKLTGGKPFMGRYR